MKTNQTLTRPMGEFSVYQRTSDGMFNATALLKQAMSSREISGLTGKRHDHILRDVDRLNINYSNMGLPKVGKGYYKHPNTGSQQHREYLLTKMQTLDLMTGYNLELRIKVNRRWEELESENISNEHFRRGF